jgi:hypothetical protein
MEASDESWDDLGDINSHAKVDDGGDGSNSPRAVLSV